MIRRVCIASIGTNSFITTSKILSNKWKFQSLINSTSLGSTNIQIMIEAQYRTFSECLRMKNKDDNGQYDEDSLFPKSKWNEEDLDPDRPIFDGYIPKEKLIATYSRSSGPGGQNVNKVNTKADIRLHIDSADWIPYIVKERLKELYANKINKEGEFIIQASSFRTQDQNMKDAIHRLKGYIQEAYNIPIEWVPREGRTEKGDAIRMKDKKKHSEKKQRRQEGKRIKNIHDY